MDSQGSVEAGEARLRLGSSAMWRILDKVTGDDVGMFYLGPRWLRADADK